MTGDRPSRPRATAIERVVVQQVHAAQVQAASAAAVMTEQVAGAGVAGSDARQALDTRLTAVEQKLNQPPA